MRDARIVPQAPRRLLVVSGAVGGVRILVIDTAWLGDLVLASPLLRAAAERLGGGRVDLITSPSGAAVSAHHPCLDGLLVLEKRGADRGLAGLLRARRWIRARRPDAVLLPRRSWRSLCLAWLAGVPRRVGFAGRGGNWLLTDVVPFRADRHQIDRNLDLLEPLGAAARPAPPLEVTCPEPERLRVATWLAARGLDRPGSFVALAPGSAWKTKQWPVERFAEVGARLAARLPIVVIGGDAERSLAAAILAAVPPGRGADATGEFTPAGSCELLRRAALMIGNDSGALHLAQAAAAPVVAIYGPTASSLGYGPRGDAHRIVEIDGLECRPCGRHGARRCPRGHWRCMLDLETGRVERAALEILAAA